MSPLDEAKLRLVEEVIADLQEEVDQLSEKRLRKRRKKEKNDQPPGLS